MGGEAGMVWDGNSRKYRCCCNNCHVKTGAMVIAILGCVGLGLNFISAIIRAVSLKDGGPQSPGAIMTQEAVSLVIGAIVVGCLLYGTLKERPGFLLPWLILQGIGLAVMGMAIIAVIILSAVGSDYLVDFVVQQSNGELSSQDVKTMFVGLTVGLVIVMVIWVAVGIWLFLVVLHFYRYLKDKQRYGQTVGAGVYAEYAAAYGQPAPVRQWQAAEAPPPYNDPYPTKG